MFYWLLNNEVNISMKLNRTWNANSRWATQELPDIMEPEGLLQCS
jgi:hypothetical protein